MASQKIDELQLQIGSDASDAIRQIGNVAAALDGAAASATRLATASGFLNGFGRGLERIANVDLNKAISALTSLSNLDLSNLKDKKVNIDVSVSGADRIDRLKYAASQAERDIGRSVTSMGKSLGKDLGMNTNGIESVKGILHDITHDLAGGGDAAEGMERLKDSIRNNAKISTAELTGMKDAYVNFLQDVEGLRLDPSSMEKDEFAEWKRLGLERLLKKGGMRIDSDVFGLDSDFLQNYSDIIDGYSVPFAVQGQFTLLREKIVEAQAALNDLVNTDASTEKIDGIVESTTAKLKDMVEVATSKRMTESADKIPIDLKIDQSRFETQIQQAINAATGKEYTTKPIRLKIDQKQLRDNVESAFSLVDIAKLPQFAHGFTDISNAISAMNQATLKNTGITPFTNSMRRLMEVDTSKFDVGTFNDIVNAIASMTQLSGIDKSINRFVSSLAKLANVGGNVKITADGLKILIPRLKEAVKTFQGLGTIDGKINQFVAGVASLASAGSKTADTAQNLRSLTKEVVLFLNAIRKAPSISDNLAMTIHGLGNLAAAGQKVGKSLGSASSAGGGKSSLGGILNTSLGKSANVVASGLKKVLEISLRLGGKGVSALGSFMQKIGLLPGAANGIDRTALSFGNLLRAIVPFYGIRGFFDWVKGSTEAGSSIVEIENVIDTAFGHLRKGFSDISGYVYDWSKSTIDAFGVSELAAKQYAGRLMSMFNSSGFDVSEGMRNSAAQMTTDLIERAGDIASFYDITVDEAMTKMQAGLAGMTRPLRSLGINMSVANLEAFALSQGITTSWKSMDQASQMALRYQYMLNASQYAEGDFTKTSMSMANQVRLLQLNFQMLSTTVGQGLISAIAPVISWLNALIRGLITAANAFRTFMWTLFGKPLAAAKGVVNEMAGYLDDTSSDLGDVGGGAADGLGSAADSAKELKKQLTVLPFDELNQLAKDTNSAGSGGGGGGGGGGGLGGLDTSSLFPDFTDAIDNSPVIDAINRWAARIREAFVKHKWASLGHIIAEGINAGFEYIYDILDWNKLKPKIVDGFIAPFQETFNSMMYWIDWDLVGRTFGRGLNDIVYTLRAWITGFEWREYGTYLAKGLNGMLDEWDADAFGRLIADKFKMAWDLFGGWVSTFDFASLGQRLKEMMFGFLDELDPEDMGTSLAEFLNGISTTIQNFLGDGTIIKELTDDFVTFVNSFLEGLDLDDIKDTIDLVKDTISTGISNSFDDIDKWELAKSLGTALSLIDWGIVGDIIAGVAAAKLAASIFGSLFKEAVKNEIAAALSGALSAGAGAGGVGAGAAGAGAAGAGAITLGTLATITATTLAIGAITIGGIALGEYIKKKGWMQLDTKGNKEKAAKVTAEGQTKNQQALNKSGMNGAGYNTSIQTVAPSEKQIRVKQIVEGQIDTSFMNAQKAILEMKKDPYVNKTVTGTQSASYKSTKTDWNGWTPETITKMANALANSSYKSTHSNWDLWNTETITKYTNGIKKDAYSKLRNDFFSWDDDNVLKLANGIGSSGYWVLSGDYQDLRDKDITLSVNQKRGYFQNLGATIQDQWNKLIEFDWYAKGGLFNGASIIGVGEAGAEAVLPLTNQKTMKMIGNAISNAGGVDSNGIDSNLATEIAMKIAPIIMSAVNGQSERPVNVNAILYTEDNEVLARAVNQGNRSIDKRYNPVAQYSY